MTSISTTDAQGLFTKKLVDVYKQRIATTGFLRSFFPSVEAPTLEVSIEVQRGFEKVAADVVRGTEGNRNSFTRSTEKIFIPPYYREYFEATDLQLYDRLYGATEITDALFAAYINSAADALLDLQNKIERSYELQCSQVLQTGVVKLISGEDIDFKRKPASIVDAGAGNYFANTDVDVFKMFEAAGVFLRTVGKAAGGMYIAVLGSRALSDLLGNNVFLKRQNLFNMALDSVSAPMMDAATGATYHGTITAGSYKIQLWAYPQYFDKNGTSTPYLDEGLVVVIPLKPQFKLAFAAVPQLITPNSPAVAGAYLMRDYIDDRKQSHIMDIRSAGIAIPTAVDQIYTFRGSAAV